MIGAGEPIHEEPEWQTEQTPMIDPVCTPPIEYWV
jgi:hypothetical protein